MLRTTLPKLSDIQRPIRDELDAVVSELRRIVFSDFPAIEEVIAAAERRGEARVDVLELVLEPLEGERRDVPPS